jgi:hypothetical protein
LVNGVTTVRLVAELDERHQIAVLAVHAQPDESLGSRHVVKNAASGRRRLGIGGLRSVGALNQRTMLVEASIIMQIRRPGNVTRFCVSDVYGSASARMKNGRPAINRMNGAWRTNANGERSSTARIAGSPTRLGLCRRLKSVRTISIRTDTTMNRMMPSQAGIAMPEVQIGETGVAPVRHALAGEREQAR